MGAHDGLLRQIEDLPKEWLVSPDMHFFTCSNQFWYQALALLSQTFHVTVLNILKQPTGAPLKDKDRISQQFRLKPPWSFHDNMKIQEAQTFSVFYCHPKASFDAQNDARQSFVRPSFAPRNAWESSLSRRGEEATTAAPKSFVQRCTQLLEERRGLGVVARAVRSYKYLCAFLFGGETWWTDMKGV